MRTWEKVAYHGCRLVLAGLFLYAGAVKAGDVKAFARAVAAYRLLPEAGSVLIAATLPWVELLTGALLLVNSRVRPAALLAALLTLGFMAVLASALWRGLDVDCGCFRSAARTSPAAALLRDAGILVLAHFTYHLRRRQTR